MSKLFGKPPPPSPPLPVMPTTDDGAAEEARRKELAAAQKARGIAATLLTGSKGASQTPLAKTSLLGG